MASKTKCNYGNMVVMGIRVLDKIKVTLCSHDQMFYGTHGSSEIKLGSWGGGGALFENEKEIIMIIIINLSFRIPTNFCPNSVKAGKEFKPECPDIP